MSGTPDKRATAGTAAPRTRRNVAPPDGSHSPRPRRTSSHPLPSESGARSCRTSAHHGTGLRPCRPHASSDLSHHGSARFPAHRHIHSYIVCLRVHPSNTPPPTPKHDSAEVAMHDVSSETEKRRDASSAASVGADLSRPGWERFGDGTTAL